MTVRVWILGAADPEMEVIKWLLRDAGERVVYALGADGQRVRAGDAYLVAALSGPIPDGATVYRIECDGPAIPADAVVIDHHRPGDPGYGRPPEEFLPASSIGQVIAELARLDALPEDWEYAGIAWSFGEDDVELFGPHGRLRALSHFGTDDLRAVGAPVALDLDSPDTCVYDEPTGSWWIIHRGGGGCDVGAWDSAAKIPADLVLIAAADHCLAAAYRGECPGVDPDALMRWRVESRAQVDWCAQRGPRSPAYMIGRAEATLRHILALPEQHEELLEAQDRDPPLVRPPEGDQG